MGTQNKSFDLAIIGGGPTGSLAAALAAESGLSVVVIEKKLLPRSKPCGGLISAGALSLLPGDLSINSIKTSPVHSIGVSRGARYYSFNTSKKLGLLLKRADFDHLLANYATGKGACLLSNCKLKDISSCNSFHYNHSPYKLTFSDKKIPPLKTRYIIGADGAMGNSALLCGIRTKKPKFTGMGLTEITETESFQGYDTDLLFSPMPHLGGMHWSFKGPGWINHGIAGLASKKRLMKTLKRLTSTKLDEKNFQAWPLPFTGPLIQAGHGNTMLIGDAAGIIDPFSGEGLFNGLLSAILAIKSINHAKKNNTKAGLTYQKYFNFYFRRYYFQSILRAFFFHARSVALPSHLPRTIASIMLHKENKV